MSARRFLALAIAAALFAALGAPQGLAKGKKKSASVVVGKDAKGDWGAGQFPAEMGHYLGQDLVEASIGVAKKKTLNFILKVTFLPPWGGMPEVTRYVWGLTVDGDYVEFDGKWTNYSRGACDPTSGQCPPPRNPGVGPFLVRGKCTTTQNVTTCEELGIVNAKFDPEAGSITIPVPMKFIGAKPGTKIQAGLSEFGSIAGGPILAIPSAFFSNTAMPVDAMQMPGKFKVPGKKRK